MNTKDKQAIRLATRTAASKLQSKTKKRHRTLNLSDTSYLAVAKYCKKNELTVSEVVDELLSAYIKEVTKE